MQAQCRKLCAENIIYNQKVSNYYQKWTKEKANSHNQMQLVLV